MRNIQLNKIKNFGQNFGKSFVFTSTFPQMVLTRARQIGESRNSGSFENLRGTRTDLGEIEGGESVSNNVASDSGALTGLVLNVLQTGAIVDLTIEYLSNGTKMDAPYEALLVPVIGNLLSLGYEGIRYFRNKQETVV